MEKNDIVKIQEEEKRKFLDHIRMLVKYWDEVPESQLSGSRTEGIAFSIKARARKPTRRLHVDR